MSVLYSFLSIFINFSPFANIFHTSVFYSFDSLLKILEFFNMYSCWLKANRSA